jgi:Zn-dependent M28 family amino/carboxypeptidase
MPHHRTGIALAVLAVVAASAATTGAAPPTFAPPPEAGLAVINEAALRAHVATLASDDFEGRLPGTRGETKTLGYLETELRAAGVQPAVNGSFRQRVPLVRKTVQPTATIRVRSMAGAEDGGRPLLPEILWAEDMTLGTGRPVEQLTVNGAEVVFAGYGIQAPEYGWDDYAGLDVTGKIVLVLGNDPGREPADSTLFGGRALTHHGLPLTKQETAARLGAKGLVVIHDPAVFGYPFDIATASAGQPKYERVPGATTKPRTELTGMLRNEAADSLFAASGLDLAALTGEAGRRGFRGRPLGLTLDASITTRLEYTESNNIVGVVRGRSRPDEYVLYTAHWDHMGIGVPVDGDSIYNGAVDNATGTAALLTLARAFQASGGSERSVIFFATTAEEQGLLGAAHYADEPPIPLEKTVGAVNMDALFPFGEADGMIVTGSGNSELEDILEWAAAFEGRVPVPDGEPEHGAFFRSDHYPLAKAGVPALFAVGGPTTLEGREALGQKYSDYINHGYHKPADELNDSWDFGGIVQDVRTYFRIGWALAQDTRWPNWHIGSEFRPLRDAMFKSR